MLTINSFALLKRASAIYGINHVSGSDGLLTYSEIGGIWGM